MKDGQRYFESVRCLGAVSVFVVNLDNWEERSIAIDGLAGTGKSTIARLLSDKTGLGYLDTGATYRAAALFATRSHLPYDEPDRLLQQLSDVNIEYRGNHTFLDGQDVSLVIRTPEISDAASRFGTLPTLRKFLVEWQRRFAANCGGAVVEGRDIGSVVLPKALVKIYLSAHDDVRVSRRDEVTREQLKIRDHRDSTRAADPLKIAPGAVEIDTSSRTIGELVDEIVGLYRLRLG